MATYKRLFQKLIADDIESSDAELNQYTEDGWELIGIYYHENENSHLVVLKKKSVHEQAVDDVAKLLKAAKDLYE